MKHQEPFTKLLKLKGTETQGDGSIEFLLLNGTIPSITI